MILVQTHVHEHAEEVEQTEDQVEMCRLRKSGSLEGGELLIHN